VVHISGSPSPESKGELVQRIKAYRDGGCMVTLDRLVEGLQGGTGESFDWSIAADLAKNGNSFILAGGLSPETVSKAVTTVGPWGVDVSSGVETNGDKDHEKIRQFITNAKNLSAINSQDQKADR
jgi:phosphoribosylanthranilate isomerase